MKNLRKKIIKIILIIVIICMIVFILIRSGIINRSLREGISVSGDDSITYTDFNNYFSFDYPKNWNVSSSSDGFDCLIYVNSGEKLNGPHIGIIRENQELEINQDEFLLQFSEDMKNNGFELESLDEIGNNNINWIEMTLSNLIEDEKYKMSIAITIQDQKIIYLVSYTASEDEFEQNIDGFNSIVNSFEL